MAKNTLIGIKAQQSEQQKTSKESDIYCLNKKVVELRVEGKKTSFGIMLCKNSNENVQFYSRLSSSIAEQQRRSKSYDHKKV